MVEAGEDQEVMEWRERERKSPDRTRHLPTTASYVAMSIIWFGQLLAYELRLYRGATGPGRAAVW